MQTLKVGSLAFYDSIGGLIPCKVVAITGYSGMAGSRQDVTFVLTASRGPWKRGERLNSWGLHVVPRKSVFANGRRIHAYRVEVQDES